MRSIAFSFVLIGAFVLANAGAPALAEVNEVRIAVGTNIGFLPLLVMRHQKLLEKHARLAGLGEIKVTWATISGGAAMNDALLSGSLDFASSGAPPLITLWDKTKGNADVKGVASMNSMPAFLNTRNSKASSIKDLTENDRIALPAVKVSNQALILQMAAEKAFGEAERFKLDRMTVSIPHPDAMIALLSGAGEITSHFTAPPFQYYELKTPGIRTILNSDEVLGGPASFTLAWTTAKFRESNPIIYRAFLLALTEAISLVNSDKPAAAAIFKEITKVKASPAEILEMLNKPEIRFTLVPENFSKIADFMHKVGSIKTKPASWKDMFFPEIHHLPGN
jgi:NitT/TauT family transport system substrate-binding protein